MPEARYTITKQVTPLPHIIINAVLGEYEVSIGLYRVSENES